MTPKKPLPPPCNHALAYAIGIRADGSRVMYCPSCCPKGKVLPKQSEGAKD
jgi:hypothetical protein